MRHILLNDIASKHKKGKNFLGPPFIKQLTENQAEPIANYNYNEYLHISAVTIFCWKIVQLC